MSTIDTALAPNTFIKPKSQSVIQGDQSFKQKLIMNYIHSVLTLSMSFGDKRLTQRLPQMHASPLQTQNIPILTTNPVLAPYLPDSYTLSRHF